ncbi:glycerone kinase [Trichosporon asahii var. asahii CBS 2479]|uniref:Glycerone kinase n=1 Tax=Trichosporon asahii var. asahii (strain ATCC 90039 / CBS 2479 / JCM 2466 / KCTC 7840 / NBRC 103889/ NCYC 2677 / UAMH 7654) TaxID=1186058 RepID=J4UEW4_TRIAS|nr:glycerone kinase [Trichosporon asahii var. asahii CBS 2479]EJT49850.1 glycerone kinase [Trichosporon asahii var. asahii CBS 2479]
MVGRRCLAGITMVCKIMGAASEEDASFEDLLKLGRSLASNIGSVCTALEHCHVPGRSEFASIPEGRIEIGLGLHNETGVMNVPLPSPESLIETMLDLILNQDDPERAFVPFAPEDVTVLMVNNQGGLSPLELGAVVDETLKQLDERGMHPQRVLSGVFMGSMNMPGMSLSVMNVSNVARDTGLSVDKIISLLDAPHTAPAWPATAGVYPLPEKLRNRPLSERLTEISPEETKESAPKGPALKADPELIRQILRKAAEDVVALEPELTHWDTLVGDGDCGETCAAGARGVLSHLDTLCASDLVSLFRELTEVIDDAMGGTLGAIFSIFLAGLTTSTMAAARQSPQPAVTPQLLGQLAMGGLETLQARTAARVGHRTVMDSLIPFAETLANSGDVKAAAQAARDGGEGTARLTAKLGRAAYVGDREDVDMPPDPGAMAFVAVAEAIAACSQ